MTARERFFNLLHKGGFRDMRAISTNEKVSPGYRFATDTDLTLIESFLDTYKTFNLFVGVAERTHRNGRKLVDCGYLRVLFIDLDFKAISEDEARALLATCPFPPTMVVFTGAGLHVYWALDEPLDLTTKAIHAKQVLLALAKKLGGDTASATPERILRVPGTLNHKYDPPQLAVLESYSETSYPLASILEWLGPLPIIKEPALLAPYKHNMEVSERIAKAKKWLSTCPPAVQGNGGDDATYKACCRVTRGHDLNEDQAFTALIDWNARCEPPWIEDDLRGKIRNAIAHATGQRGEDLASRPSRQLTLTKASQIQIAPVHWCWQNRLAFGEFSLLGGREGIGKSMLAYWLAAEITTGRLPGANFKTAKSVIIAATEDSWEHTIVPRLMAAKADLNKIFRIEVETEYGVHGSLTLPKDNTELQHHILENDVALVLLDPLMSRLDAKIDSHKDQETRQALEPLSKIAHDTHCVVLGIIHVNKSQSSDPLTMLMGSRAFAAVARQVLFVLADTEHPPKGRMLGQVKNNLGESDELPARLFHIDKVYVGKTDEGDVYTGKLIWDGETTKRSVMGEIEINQAGVDRPATVAAAEFIVDFLTLKGGYAESILVKDEARKRRHLGGTLERARKHANVKDVRKGFPGVTFWYLDDFDPSLIPVPVKKKEEEM